MATVFQDGKDLNGDIIWKVHLLGRDEGGDYPEFARNDASSSYDNVVVECGLWRYKCSTGEYRVITANPHATPGWGYETEVKGYMNTYYYTVGFGVNKTVYGAIDFDYIHNGEHESHIMVPGEGCKTFFALDNDVTVMGANRRFYEISAPLDPEEELEVFLTKLYNTNCFDSIILAAGEIAFPDFEDVEIYQEDPEN